MSKPKYHHIISSFYLKGFTTTGDKSGILHAYNLIRRSGFCGKPRSMGGETHFYRVNSETGDPTRIERLMADHIERPCSQLLHEVRAAETIPSGQHLTGLLDLAALYFARGRFARHLSLIHNQKRITDLLLRGEMTQAQWDTYVSDQRWANRGDEAIPESVEEARIQAIQGKFNPKAMPTASVVGTIELAEAIYKQLRARPWSLLIAEKDGAGSFITSGSPLTSREAWPTLGFDEGISNPKAYLAFPLDRRLALISWDRKPNCRYVAPEAVVALVNARTLNGSCGEIYWDGTDFPLIDAAGKTARFGSFRKDLETNPEAFAIGPWIRTGSLLIRVPKGKWNSK